MLITRYFCHACGYEPRAQTDGYAYVLDSIGRRIVCPHPIEDATAREVTGGLGWFDAVQAKRAGFMLTFVCAACASISDLDPERDPKRCERCGGSELKTLDEMVGQPCPKCRRGNIGSEPLGIA